MKTKMLFIALTIFISASFLTSCEKVKGKGEVVTETRSTGTYNSIGLAMSATIYFTPGAEYSLQIRGQENILKQVETQVEGNQLIVRVKRGVILGNHEPITVYITAPDVSGLDVSGSGDINTSGPWNAGGVSVNISGSGNINLGTLVAESLSAKISGSGNINATGGTVIREDLHISGSGTIDLRSIVSQTVYTTTSGSGDTYVNAVTLLDVTISGSGNIWYYGTPAINTHISGSGNLHRL
jgi:hypothetical protein